MYALSIKVRQGKLDYLFLIHKNSGREVIFHYSLIKKILQIKLSAKASELYTYILVTTVSEVQLSDLCCAVK